LAELENVAREKGVEKIGLHVFGHNAAARALYQKVGYIETNVNMSKKIF
jgi:ribosomal protein S18 acetylase RimI-like enzyme